MRYCGVDVERVEIDIKLITRTRQNLKAIAFVLNYVVILCREISRTCHVQVSMEIGELSCD